MISKELLSEVFNTKVIKIVTDTKQMAYSLDGSVKKDGKVIMYATNKWHKINIYELAYKCKEWAREYQDYNLITLELRGKWLCVDWYKQSKNISSKCNTEPEAIFKACQWILENKEKQ